MENLPLFLYLIEVFNSEGGCAVVGVLCLVILTLLGLFPKYENPVCEGEHISTFFSKVGGLSYLKPVFILMIIWGTLLPSKEGWYKIIAAYGVTEIIANPALQETAGKSLEVLNKAMAEYLGEKDDK